MAARALVAAAALAVVVGWTVWAAPAVAESWTWPVRGPVVGAFVDVGGEYVAGGHRGIDVAAPTGTPVVAAAGGTVRFAGVVGSSGLTVSIRTADGRYDTSYLHLSETAVRAGETVGGGEQIAAVGTTGAGSSPGPHLHFGVRDAGTRRYRDPLDLLPSPNGAPDVPHVGPAPRGIPAVPRVGPAPRRIPVLPRAGWAPRTAPLFARPAFAAPARVPWPASARPAPGRLGWAIACAALILAAILLGSSIGVRAVLRHNADLLRQRGAAPGPRLHDGRR